MIEISIPIISFKEDDPMKKIRVEEHIENITKRGRTVCVPMHYAYLIDGGQKLYLCKQRRYHGVAHYFHRDLPVDAIYRHKWGRNKMVDKLMAKLPKCLADAERYADEYAA